LLTDINAEALEELAAITGSSHVIDCGRLIGGMD